MKPYFVESELYYNSSDERNTIIKCLGSAKFARPMMIRSDHNYIRQRSWYGPSQQPVEAKFQIRILN